MKPTSKLIICVAAAACGIPSMQAKDPVAKNLYDFDFIEQTNPWLTSYNGAGLRWLKVPSTSQVEAFYSKSNGDFKNYYESNDSYTFGLNAESYYTLKRTTFYGKAAYENFMGKEMTGSVWIDPYDAPFNILEYYDTDAGKKNREKYMIAAGVGYDLVKGLRIGARFDYTATNYAKRKDLRHTNTQLDMNLTAGLTYTLADRFTIGANYIYARNIEEVEYDTYGTTDKQYYLHIAPGAFYGNWELFGGSGYTAGNFAVPLFNEYQGIAAQLAFNTQKVDLFYEFTYKSREGYYGFKHDTYDPQLTEHESDIFEHKVYAAVKGDRSVHKLSANIAYQDLDNYELAYETGKDEGGTFYITYFGRNQNNNRQTLSIDGEYQSAWGLEGLTPRWIVSIDGRYWQQNLTASIYPFYRDQKIKQAAANLGVQRNFFIGRNLIGVSLKGGYAKGGGFEKKDGTYTTPSASTAVPRESEWYMHQEFEYLTAERFNGAVSARYTRMFNKGINAFIDLRYNFTSARDIVYLDGKGFNVFQIALGCTF